MKVAILCSGLGRVTRGYERFADDLSMHLRSHANVTTFGSRGHKATSELRPVLSLSRDGVVSKLPWVSSQSYRDPYYWEGMTFSAAVLPRIARNRFDIIHVMDPPMVNFFYRFRPVLGRHTKVILTNGVGMHDESCTRVDHLHQVSRIAYDEALEYMPESRMTMVPYPVDPHRLGGVGRDEARRHLDIPPDEFLVVSVAALNRGHKRIDWLIHEVAQLLSVSLLVVGRVEDRTLLQLGRELLGERFFHRELSFDAVALVYEAADIFALASLEEGFAISVVEAMMSGLPVLVHSNDHFRWLLGSDDGLVDMTRRGALASAIEASRAGIDQARPDLRTRAVERFSWDALLPRYLEMYERALRS